MAQEFDPTAEASILVSDLNRIREILSGCLVFSTAHDIARSQQQMVGARPSPLTREVESVKERVDGILGDFLLNQYTEDLERDEEIAEDEELEELSPLPLGEPSFRQASKRVDLEDETEWEDDSRAWPEEALQ